MSRLIAIQTGHNSGVAVFEDGRLLRVLTEEKFTDVKCQGGFPVQCFRQLSLERLNHPDRVVVCNMTQFRISPEPDVVSHIAAGGARCAVDWTQHHLCLPRFPFWLLMNSVYKLRTASLRPELYRLIFEHVGVFPEEVTFMDHHTLHALSPIVFYNLYDDPKPILSITMDGMGDDSSGKVFVVHKGEHTLLASTRAEDSVACLYGEVTNFLGMRALYHEYKVMGLAGYVPDEACDHLMPIFRSVAKVDGLVVRARKDLLLSRYWLRQHFVGRRFDHIAAAMQRFLEEIAMQLIRNAINHTGIHRVALSGGAFMNCKLNQKIAMMPEVTKAWFMPGCGDETVTIGAGLSEGPMFTSGTVYDGVEFGDDEIRAWIKKNWTGRCYRTEDPERCVAKLLAGGDVVARCSGRSEWGPRALGNRSILANPSMRDGASRLNDQIKCRDFWMPFSPTVLAESADDYIQHWERLREVCGESMEHMTVTADTNSSARVRLSAAMHAKDKTIRPQVLHEKANPSYYRLIKHFKELTGTGAVLNTSLNVHGKPMAATLKQVTDTFQNSGLTHMQLGNYILSK